MADTSVSYQCPNCGAPLQFKPKDKTVTCDYCDTKFDVPTLEALYAQKEARAAAADAARKVRWKTDGAGQAWSDDEAAHLQTYTCSSCGAEIVCDENTMATECCYCGNPTLIPSRFSGMLKPDYVIPFKKTKEEAVAALKQFYQGRWLLPRAFTANNRVEAIQPMYVPFWLFDGGAEGAASYRASNTNVYETGDYEITETRHYHVVRAGSLVFEKIPVDASSKMPDDHMDSIEPFDYAQLRPFSTAYLPGYLADKYDVTIDDSRDRADTRCRETLAQALRDTVTGYGACVTEREDIALRRSKVHYALLPVWMLSTKWHGQDFLFAMNGQTGKLVGDLPLDKGLYWKHFAAITGLCMLGVMAAGLLLSL